MNGEGNGAAKLARLASLVIIGVGIVSLLTAAYFNSGDRLAFESLPANGGTVGPITITDPGTVLQVTVKQPQTLPTRRSSRGFGSYGTTSNSTWTFVEGEVLDEDEQYLFGFGEELWKETGYDGSYWTESYDEFDLKVTIPDPGTYYLGFTTQVAPGSSPGTMQVRVDRMRGSAIPHFVFGIVAILLGLLLRFMTSNAVASSMSEVMEGA